jgi:hypothetical protein
MLRSAAWRLVHSNDDQRKHAVCTEAPQTAATWGKLVAKSGSHHAEGSKEGGPKYCHRLPARLKEMMARKPAAKEEGRSFTTEVVKDSG